MTSLVSDESCGCFSLENAHMHIHDSAYYWGFTWLALRRNFSKVWSRQGLWDILGNFSQILLMTPTLSSSSSSSSSLRRCKHTQK